MAKWLGPGAAPSRPAALQAGFLEALAEHVCAFNQWPCGSVTVEASYQAPTRETVLSARTPHGVGTASVADYAYGHAANERWLWADAALTAAAQATLRFQEELARAKRREQALTRKLRRAERTTVPEVPRGRAIKLTGTL